MKLRRIFGLSIPVLLLLACIVVLAEVQKPPSAHPQGPCRTCRDSKRGTFTRVTAQAVICGKDPARTSGKSLGRTKALHPGLCPCAVQLAIMRSFTSFGLFRRRLLDPCGDKGYVRWPEGLAGNFVATQVESRCEPITASTGATISGKCMLSLRFEERD